MIKKIAFIALSLFFTGQLVAQEVWMHPNAGQWDDRIEYKVELTIGEMLIEKDGFTYFLNNAKEKKHHVHENDGQNVDDDDIYQAHVIKSKFIGSSWSGKTDKIDSSAFYRNYITGNDASKWKGHLKSSSKLAFKDYYPGIDLKLDGSNSQLKYSLIVQPGINVEQIVMQYEGQDDLFLDDEGNLHSTNRFGEIIEDKPVAWTENDGRHKKVDVEFEINDTEVTFVFPKGYDNTKVLVIDPSITFSTFTGSTADNWGMSATPDDNENAFGGGVVFALGYPITVNAYDASFNGAVDLGITKFNPSGTALVYSTYIGGNGSETPNSMICSPANELYIYGLTSSSNFPMAGTPFDATYNGGPNVSTTSNGLGFSDGTDLFVLRLSQDGSTLLNSTYVGGTGTDGLNNTTLKYNYGDQFRGEIFLDDAGDVYVASTTQSADFPTLLGPQGSLNGSQDAVVFKMPPTLNMMIWSGYFGGSNDETGNSIQVSSTGDVYVVGGTTSNSLPYTLGADLTFNGGAADGYVAKLNGLNGAIISGSFMGLNEYDQAYCVQLDIDDNVYVFGQTESNWPITAGHYGVANSGQFIRKYNPNLTSVLWTTMVGAGTGHVEISPTAFLVSDCYDIYFSGWGGQLNVVNSQAVFSTSTGFPVTFDAFQSNTSGSNFYLAVLDEDAMNLKYGTFMGGTVGSYNHVDGGTSRFDKEGTIYHSVCAACGGSPNGFSSTPGAWSTTNQSSNCNMAVFKFELAAIDAVVANQNTVVCLPDPVYFQNTSINGNSFFWDFGDGTFSTDLNPVHLYPGPGDYDVSLIVVDTNGCFSSDSVDFVMHIGDLNGTLVQPAGPICPGEPYQFDASGGSIYSWTPAQFLDNPNSATPIATIDVTTEFTVIISDTCGVDTLTVTLAVFASNISVSNDTSLCVGQSTNLVASGGASYVWSPATYLDDPFIATPLCTPDLPTLYFVEITTVDGCVSTDSVFVDVFFNLPVPVIPDTVELCKGETSLINVSGATSYLWSPTTNIAPTTGSSVTVNPSSDMFYYCDFTNACGTLKDSVFIDVLIANVTAGTDTTICPGESAELWVTGGVSYAWHPTSTLNFWKDSLVTVTPNQSTLYFVIGEDINGCIDQDSVWVELYPEPTIEITPSILFVDYGDIIELTAVSPASGPYHWSPPDFLSCINCNSTIANPEQNYAYTVSVTDSNGCTANDVVHIYYKPILYIPNTFTPDGDAYNNQFMVYISEKENVTDFHMEIFNRWGEMIFESFDFNVGWDGTYAGQKCQDGTYVWKVTLKSTSNEETEHVGHVNILR